ncbi:MAG TPA: DUF5060 domain-containing protein, partial [Thermomicrobiales bacterium]|nr:DUF5060 domain-containing protein [Thermomicrobiales bacterium]
MSMQSFRTVHEMTFTTATAYTNPFTDVTVRAAFTSPSGARSIIEAFHDGDANWKVRFNPGESGEWAWTLASVPPNPDFEQGGTFTVQQSIDRGFLKSTPDTAWGFAFEN